MIRAQFISKFPHTCEKNDGVEHPDYKPDEVTKIVDYYIRFAADPEFKVRMQKQLYDIDDPKLTDALLDSDEPEIGNADLEYFDELQRNRNKQTEKLNDD